MLSHLINVNVLLRNITSYDFPVFIVLLTTCRCSCIYSCHFCYQLWISCHLTIQKMQR